MKKEENKEEQKGNKNNQIGTLSTKARKYRNIYINKQAEIGMQHECRNTRSRNFYWHGY